MSHPYSTQDYARTLSHLGTPIDVPEWGCSVLARPIREGMFDVTGVYPATIFMEDASLKAGLDRLRRQGFVSVVVVLTPDQRPSLERLKRAFDVVRPFKRHYILRPTSPAHAYDKHHRYEIRRALRHVETGPLDLKAWQPAWTALYKYLGERHDLGAVHRFSPDHMRHLATSSAFHAFGAWHQDELVSAHVWAVHGGTAISHLAASNDTGYRLGAAYAVNAVSLEHFETLSLVNFGGVAGAEDNIDGGLARFKRGFSNDSNPALICGSILQSDLYENLCASSGQDQRHSSFFPAYRAKREAASS